MGEHVAAGMEERKTQQRDPIFASTRLDCTKGLTLIPSADHTPLPSPHPHLLQPLLNSAPLALLSILLYRPLIAQQNLLEMRYAFLARGKEGNGVSGGEGSLQDVEVDAAVFGEEGDGGEAEVDEDLC